MRILLVVLCVLSVGICLKNELHKIYPVYSDHYCKRQCNGRPLNCIYNLTLDIFFTNQADCFSCTSGNRHDCKNPQCIPGDGAKRAISIFNGILPGPTIEVCQGDSVTVNVLNLLNPATTSVHWHGVKLHKNYWMDGVPMITQCPITPGSRFLYKFIAEDDGTFYYHSHSGPQRADGAFGPLIVKQERTKNVYSEWYDYDKTEHVISLVEWTSDRAEDNYFQYLRQKISFYTEIRTVLVNGYGPMRDNSVPPAKFLVKQGKRYRFRLINAANMVCPFDVSIEGHRLTVISSDIDDIQPLVVDRLIVTNGERYDFILTADQPIDCYAIRIYGGQLCQVQSLAILAYENAPEREISFSDDYNLNPEHTVLNCYDNTVQGTCVNYEEMSSVVEIEPELLGPVALQQYITVNSPIYARERFRGVNETELYVQHMNNILFKMPSTPLIFDLKQGCDTNSCKTPYCECTNVLKINRDHAVELVIVNEGTDLNISHPIHLHGNSFRVIAEKNLGVSVETSYVRQLDSEGKLGRNFSFPIIKDTVTVDDGSYVVIRFMANNPGIWFFHCHDDFHTEEGMAMVLVVEPVPKPPKKFIRCGDYLG